MPEAPSTLVQMLFATSLLLPLGLATLGAVYLIGVIVAQAFKGKHGH